MIRYAAAYLTTGLVFAGMDAVFLTLAGDRLYRPILGAVMADGFRLAPAVVFYLVYLAGIQVFVVAPALKAGGGWRRSLGMGALYGAFCYATYDLTNQATLAVWSTTITLVDITWGAVVTGVAAAAGTVAALRFARP